MDNAELREIFLDEFDELYDLAQDALAALEKGDMSRLSDLRRAFHTWKGNAALFELHQLRELSAAYNTFLVSQKDAPQLTS